MVRRENMFERHAEKSDVKYKFEWHIGKLQGMSQKCM